MSLECLEVTYVFGMFGGDEASFAHLNRHSLATCWLASDSLPADVVPPPALDYAATLGSPHIYDRCSRICLVVHVWASPPAHADSLTLLGPRCLRPNRPVQRTMMIVTETLNAWMGRWLVL
jgi:hypothetical protein